MYKFTKYFIVFAVVAIGACIPLKHTGYNCGSFQKVVDVVYNAFFSKPSSEETLLRRLRAIRKQELKDVEEAKKTVETIAKKINEYSKDVDTGENFANRLYEAIEAQDYPTSILDKTFESEQDVKDTFESVLSQLEARQSSVNQMKKLLREAEKNRDSAIKKLADTDAKIANVETIIAQRKREKREKIDVDEYLQKKTEEQKADESVLVLSDLTALSELLAEEDKKIEKAGKERLEVEQNEKRFKEYCVKYQTRLKNKNKTNKSESID